MYSPEYTNQFKKSFKRMIKRGAKTDLFWQVADMVLCGEILPEKYKLHKLLGNYEGYFECHIQPDWLLIYKVLKEEQIIIFIDTGSHSDLF